MTGKIKGGICRQCDDTKDIMPTSLYNGMFFI